MAGETGEQRHSPVSPHRLDSLPVVPDTGNTHTEDKDTAMSDTAQKTKQYAAEVPFEPATGGFTFEPPTRRSGERQGRKRSDYQLKLDELVGEAYGKPFTGVYVPNDERSINDMVKRIRNSGTHLGLGIRFGQVQPTQDDGIVVLVFKVQDKRARKTKNDGE